jgi:uncharacterized membrane protein YdjX (TVP38/TMEM64 family)
MMRFAVATMAGMIPASFLLAHFGAEMRADDGTGMIIGLSIFAAAILLPPSILYAYRKRKNAP